MGALIIIAVMFILLWLLLIRPQRARQQQQKQLLESVSVGDEVLTVGGIYGIVEEIEDDESLVVQIAEGINVRVARRAVATVVKPDDDDEDSDEVIDAEAESMHDETLVASDGEATVKPDQDSVRDEAAAGTATAERS